MECPHTLIEPALDRWSECHWHLHQMEANYHEPAAFRYAANSFIRAFKEVPQLLKMTTQNHSELRKAMENRFKSLSDSDLYKKLKSTRDFLVHQGMLELESRGSAGTTEGPKVKISFPFMVHPWESSDEAYTRYKEVCRTDKMMRNLIGPDCDSAPAIWRTWIINAFPGRDLLEVAFEAWVKLGELLSAVIEARGGEPLNLSMPCRHNPELVKIKRFSQHDFFLEVEGIDLEKEAQKWRKEKTLHAAASTAPKKQSRPAVCGFSVGRKLTQAVPIVGQFSLKCHVNLKLNRSPCPINSRLMPLRY